MSDIFSDTSAAEEFLAKDQASPTENKEVQSTEQAPQLDASATSAEKAEVVAALVELEKLEKFKFGGKEWTGPAFKEEFDKGTLRLQDYTKKTQAVAEERRALEEEKKFNDNLEYDLDLVKANPRAILKDGRDVVTAFMQTYPERYHSSLQKALNGPSEQTGQPPVQQTPQVDFHTLKRLERFEKILDAQETAKYENEIERTMTDLSAKYPLAGEFKELVMARAESVIGQGGAEFSKELWEDIFKQVNHKVDGIIKAQYGTLVKKQTEANAKSQDVGAGGGTAGRAPQKFSKFDDLAKYAEEFSRS